MPLVMTAPAGTAARTMLGERIAAAKAGDPLAPVTVAVPSPYAGLSLRRRLGSQPGGLVNVAFLPLARIAELLGAPALAASGRRPLSGAVRREALRVLLRDGDGLFGPIAGHPTTIRSLDRTLQELRACPAESLGRLEQAGPRAAEIVSLYHRLRSRLEARWYDEHDLAAAAADAVRGDSPVVADLGHVIVFCPRRLDPSSAGLVEALGDAATVIEAGGAGARPVATSIVGCADPDEEVRAAVRGITERLARPEPTPLHRMAVLCPPGGPYATIAHQQLAAAGIPFNGPGAATLASSVAGRALVGILDLCAGDLARNELASWLASAPILEQAGGTDLAPATHWDTLSRRAGVVTGGHWKDRLDNLVADLHEQASRLDGSEPGAGEDDAKSERRRRRIEGDIKAVERLHLFVEELGTALEAGSRTTWTAMSAWAAGILHRYLGGPAQHRHWPEEEQKALHGVHLLLDRLAPLDAMGGAVDPSAFRQAVAIELEEPAGHQGTFGDGVFVGPVGSAWAADFDTVFVLGLAEGSLPRLGRQDALLPDRERRIAGELPLRGDRQGDEHARYLAALASAPERVLLWPRADLRAGRQRLPSRWLLDTASHLAGRPMFSGDLGALAGTGPEHFVHDVASFEAGIRHAEEPCSVLDHDLASLLEWKAAGGDVVHHHLVAASPVLSAGMAATAGRESDQFTRFDGNVRGGADTLAAGAALSPTSLQTYAQCPLRYFLTRQLGLEAEEKPEDVLTIGPMKRGTLVHAILENYVTSLLDGQPRSLDRLLEMAEAHFTAIEAKGLTGRRVLWRYERQKMVRELERIHSLDADMTPLAAELSFGDGVHEPVTLTLPNGRTIGFRGQADRVDRDKAGALVVTDYKTGSSKGYKVLETDPVDRGTKLQLPLYAMAARQRFPDEGPALPVRSRYWMISEKGGFEEFPIELTGDVMDRFSQVLGVIVDGITNGNFPARPGKPDRKTTENCRLCDMGPLCQEDRDRQWERNKAAPALAAYVELAEGEAHGKGGASDG